MNELLASLNLTHTDYLNALIAFIAFIVLAKAADLFIDKGVRRLTAKTRGEFDDDALDVMHRPAYYTIILIGFYVSVLLLKLHREVLDSMVAFLLTIGVLLWAATMFRLANRIVEHMARRSTDSTGLRREIVPLVKNLITVGVALVGIAVVFSIWKINITPLFASAGLVGAAVAFAAKDTLGNFFGGISIFLDRPYKIGDYVNLDSGERGEVVEIGIRSTRIKTRDDILISIPNSIIANGKIINESAPFPKFRIRVPVSAAYGSDVDLIESVLMEIASGNENVYKEPKPRVRFRRMGDSSLDFELLCWAIEPARRGLTIHELNKTIYMTFNSKGIQIPFPQMDVHIRRDS